MDKRTYFVSVLCNNQINYYILLTTINQFIRLYCNWVDICRRERGMDN